MSESIRKLPAQEQRVETGPLQFGDDWPGVFIRGDHAFHFAMSLRAATSGRVFDPILQAEVDGLLDTLISADLTGISRA